MPFEGKDGQLSQPVVLVAFSLGEATNWRVPKWLVCLCVLAKRMRPSVSEHVHLHFYVLSLPFFKDANGNNKAIQILADQQGNGKAPCFDSFAYAPCVWSEECMKKTKERGSSSKPCSQFGLCLLLKLQWSSHAAAAINIVCILNLVNLTTFTWERWVKERGWRCLTKKEEGRRLQLATWNKLAWAVCHFSLDGTFLRWQAVRHWMQWDALHLRDSYFASFLFKWKHNVSQAVNNKQANMPFCTLYPTATIDKKATDASSSLPMEYTLRK